MRKIYNGTTGTGKTTKLKEIYHELARTNPTDEILVLVQNALSVREWKNSLKISSAGPLNIYTFFGLAQQEVKTYWPLLVEKADAPLEPFFMNIETAHYLMTRIVEKRREKKDYFKNLNSTSNNIAVQLIDNLNQAALNMLSLGELKNRLLDWAADDKEMKQIFQEAVRLMQQFRQSCRQYSVIDYSLLVKMYLNLFEEPDYIQAGKTAYKYILVDDLEMSPPASQELIELLDTNAETSYLTYNPEGKINRFFGGNPKLAQKKFFSGAEIEELTYSYSASLDAIEIGEKLKREINRSQQFKQLSLNSNYIKGRINTEFRGDMLLKVADEVNILIDSGVAPEEVAIIAPHIDKVVEFTFSDAFKPKGYNIYNLLRSKRLIDIPYSQALLSLACLNYKEWQVKPALTSLQQSFVLLLDLDPVRGAYFAEKTIKNDYNLPDPADKGLRQRLGFKKQEEYQRLYSWLNQKSGENLPAAHYFQLIFAELLAPLTPDDEEIFACRQIITSYLRFEEVMHAYQITDSSRIGRYFINMINKGILAGEVLKEPGHKIENKVILSTPYKFLTSPDVKAVEFLFLLDIGSTFWMSGITKELLNPYLLSPQWQDKSQWNDRIDRSLKKDQLLDYILSLLKKTKSGLYLAGSLFDSRGVEQDGEFANWFI
ncbi:MAG: UvrD-helicase domain-containing protein [Bacillota bacterium]